MFPDLFAFTIPFVYLIASAVFGNGDFNFGHHVELEEPAVANGTWIFHLTPVLYSISHSLFVFALIFCIASVIWMKKFKRMPFEMLGWLLHILMDIPTHSYKFYPTPFLWPISEYKFDGFSWGQTWFIVLNYSALAVFAIYLRYRKKKVK